MSPRVSQFFRHPDPPSRREALQPIAGVSLELYADLRALMTRAGDEPEAHVEIAHQHGVDRLAWQVAAAGWTMRMDDPTTAHVVAPRFMALHRAALARIRARVDAIDDGPGSEDPRRG